MSDHEAALPSQPAETLTWPPPGLERLHGELPPLSRAFRGAGLLLLVPLLIAVATPQPYWSRGPFGDSWWLPVVTTFIAAFLLVGASIRLAHLLRGFQDARRLGYGVSLGIITASDVEHDAGAALQGKDIYGAMSADNRRYVLYARSLARLTSLAGAIWLTLAAALVVLMGYAQLIGPVGAWVLPFAPFMLLGAVGVFSRAAEGTLMRQAQRAWGTPADARTAEVENAAQWQHTLAIINDEDVPDDPLPFVAQRRRIWVLPALAMVPVLAVLVPFGFLLIAAALGPFVSGYFSSGFGGRQTGIHSLRLLLPLTVPLDSSITPKRAGEALLNLVRGYGHPPQPVLVEDGERIEYSALEADRMRRLNAASQTATRLLPVVARDRSNPLFPEHLWSDSLLRKAASGRLSSAQRATLDTIDTRGLREDFAIVARAATIDVAGTHWKTPLPEDIGASLLLQNYGSTMSRAARFMVLAAAKELMAGRRVEAEAVLRDLISAGFRIMEQGGGSIAIYEAIGAVSEGALALTALYEVEGRMLEAERLRTLREVRQLSFAPSPYIGNSNPREPYRTLALMVTAQDALPTTRWNEFINFNQVSPCLNYRNALFGESKDYLSWVERARKLMVHFPADSALFERAREGRVAAVGERSLLRCTMPLRSLKYFFD